MLEIIEEKDEKTITESAVKILQAYVNKFPNLAGETFEKLVMELKNKE